ncbi:hypothetical protein CNO13_07980 (plasmid) [Borrelia miyamotoi]|uniref:Uncharacterized protein n=2 Tax=Borrelia miyamotoi TaxID=47466 RepID=A0AAQ3HEC1_9SPIR|nr:hypothetical protein [Borrelia miyamotoi]AHH05990.1 Adenine-specific methyltransferase [Borrelia miyamotoi FR64b]ATQ17951.1 hypothetical protein CNO12_06675 [Borrelia miyamotoi]ATQ19205.1 hypothetical protein CNO11_06660 [Borrelia miyamotoi]ATQ20473.1 hypothetical protein CNO10_06785 [Borrelia miyamotoi]QBK62592.1 hypothetical protein EZU67_05450 [Borrelia miyamotoi]
MDRNSVDKKIESVEKLASIFAKRTRILKDLVEQYLDVYLKVKKQNALVETYNIIKSNIYNQQCS